MKGLVSVAEELQTFCEQHSWKFCIIGGLALQFWGEPRLTIDVDITLLTGFGGEERYIDGFLSKFPARIEDAKAFALQKRVLLLRSEDGIGIDVSLGALPFEEGLVKRAVYVRYLPDVSLKICTAEDLIVLKAFAARDRDWVDISTILIKQDNLDWNYVIDQLTPLVELKEAPEIIEKLRDLRVKFE